MISWRFFISSLQWRHNGRDCVSNHQPRHCLLNRLISRRSKKTSKLRVTRLFAKLHLWPVNPPHKWPVTRKMFPFDDIIMSPLYSTCSCKLWSLLHNYIVTQTNHCLWPYSGRVIITWTCLGHNVCTRVANCLYTHESVSLVFIKHQINTQVSA